jgi:hypothetical protein
MSIKIKVSGIQSVISGLADYSNEIQKEVASEIQDWAKRTVADAQRDVPFKTGDLKSTIRDVVGADRLTWIVKVGGINGVNYAPYVVFGTGTFVSDSFLQEYGLVKYASDFKGKGIREVNLPMRDFLYRNARTEFEKTFQNIKKILENNRNL